MKSIQEQEASQQSSVDATQTHGCVPQSNSAYAEDNGLSSSSPSASSGSWVMDFLAPGEATKAGTEAVADWIENGFDGEEDGQWEQVARAVPGAVAMGGAAIYGGVVDTASSIWGLTPWGD